MIAYNPEGTPEENDRYTELERRFQEGFNAADPFAHRLLPDIPMTITGPALHPTQVRAYALLAAANIPLPAPSGQRGFSYESVSEWEAKVLRSAARFERYIKESEELPDGNTEV